MQTKEVQRTNQRSVQ